METYIIGGVVGAIVVACILALIYAIGILPKLRRQNQINRDIESQNQQNKQECLMWQSKRDLLVEEIDKLSGERVELISSIEVARTQIQSLEAQKAELQILQAQLIELRPSIQNLENKKLELAEQCSKQGLQCEELLAQIDKLSESRRILESEVASSRSAKEELLASIEEMRQQVDENISLYYEKTMTTMQDTLSENAEKAGIEYQEHLEEYRKEFQQTVQEMVTGIDGEIQEKKERLNQLKGELADLHKIVLSAIEAQKRAEDDNKDFYRLSLSDIDLKEIFHLREVIPYLREARPLYKMIWEGYYQRTYKDLVARIMGDKKVVCGIYKLTNLLDGKVYIGQAKNIAERWSEHIKKGVGIDTNNQILYVAMRKDGPENFTYEILEECTSQELNDKEKFWIKYYKATEHGYNMKVG